MDGKIFENSFAKEGYGFDDFEVAFAVFWMKKCLKVNKKIKFKNNQEFLKTFKMLKVFKKNLK